MILRIARFRHGRRGFRPSHWGLRLAATALTLGVVLHPAASHASPAAATTAPVTQMAHISVVATGQGSPVILIPGLSSPRAVWDGVVPGLARDHRVYVVQVNGFGGDAPGANLAPGILDGVVADLHALIAKERIAGAAVVGHSMGGLAALMLAKAHPADAGKLMIVDSLPFIGTLFAPGASVAAIEPQARAMRDAQAASYGKPASEAMATATADRLAAKAASRTQVAAWFKTADPRVSGQAMYEDLTTDLRPAMAGIATPITVVYPFAPTGTTRAQADALYKAAYADAPHVTFVAIGDAAHFVMLDQPAAFAAALTAFAAR
ncbi:pimeloyl-ACP methyl ester carboxylesterase [Sphingomonas insulae]|uniref:Alpha/beta hydrolase n=1 Tax=Sphingomonas insulae TaxID=424800 RepID=A0ABN1HTC0_9SPHN|nr:alpha/beta hydrolase [Sphingomonas insulae]NIJ28090.1 pimeloyl-ACP methyl ester carboxylesterase [Sphingomonas insulae]